MDPLDDILETLAFKGALYFRTDFSGPWAVAVPEHPGAARFHLLVQGRVRASVGPARIDLGPGDLLMIPRGRAHVLAAPESDPDQPATLERVLADAGFDGAGALILGSGDPAASTQMVCGHFAFRPGADHALLRELPDHLHLSASARARAPWLDDALRLVARRMLEGGAGAAATVTRMSEIVFIETLRAGLAGEARMLAAFADPRLGRALRAIHADPARGWTLPSLAAEAGMSRTVFAERFREAAGAAPMAYLFEWRMQKALALLERGDRKVAAVAAATGYRSAAAFSRAFAQHFGRAPSERRDTP